MTARDICSKYLAISVVDSGEEVDVNYKVSAALHRIHAINSRFGLVTRLSFPDWRAPVTTVSGSVFRTGCTGLRLRVFGTPQDLEVVSREFALAMDYRRGAVLLSEIREAPTPRGWISFRRDQQSAKGTKGQLARQARRDERRNIIATQRKVARTPDDPVARGCVGVSVASVRGDVSHGYTLWIRREVVEISAIDTKMLSTWGLAGAVPDF